MCWIFHETLPIWLPIRCPLKKIVYASWKVLKICLGAPKRWLILSDSVRCFGNFWSLGRCFDLFVDKHKCAFSLNWLKTVAWPVGPVLKFRDIPDCWFHCCDLRFTKRCNNVKKVLNLRYNLIYLLYEGVQNFAVYISKKGWPFPETTPSSGNSQHKLKMRKSKLKVCASRSVQVIEWISIGPFP